MHFKVRNFTFQKESKTHIFKGHYKLTGKSQLNYRIIKFNISMSLRIQ